MNTKQKKYFIKKQKKRLKRKLKLSFYKKKIFKKNNKKTKKTRKISKRQLIYLERKEILQELYKKFNYSEKNFVISISNELGLEKNGNRDYYLNIASQIIDFNNKALIFDLEKCSKIWPSGITLLCSLKKWVELSNRFSINIKRPRIASTSPRDNKVESYLSHCGFYDYVGRPYVSQLSKHYSEDDIVKIKREEAKSKFELKDIVENRENEIIELLEKHSTFDVEQIELFNSVILTEIINNILEHGITYNDQGWWILAQHHETTKIISLCIADNGIGIRNSLTTGPQKEDILKKKIPNNPFNDGKFIEMAMNENVSGSTKAIKKEKEYLIFYNYPKGSRRGNGLSRIKESCIELKIPLTILSHNGYLFQDIEGSIDSGSKSNRVFAGTLYQLNIPAK